MAADQTAGWAIIAATAVSYTSLAPLGFPLGDFGWATAAVAVGSACGTLLELRSDIKAATIRSAAYYLGVGVTGILSSPLIGGVALAAVRAVGFIPDMAAIPILMGFGYGGKPLLDLVIGIAKSGITAKLGASGKGAGEP